MDLVVEHLLVEVPRCSSFFPTRFSGWPTSSSAGMMPPYEAQGELRRIPIPRTPVNRASASLSVRLSTPSRGATIKKNMTVASFPLPPLQGRCSKRLGLTLPHPSDQDDAGDNDPYGKEHVNKDPSQRIWRHRHQECYPQEADDQHSSSPPQPAG